MNEEQKQVHVMQVIRTQLLRKGSGVEENPVRIIEQYWDMNGNFIFEKDPIGCIDCFNSKKKIKLPQTTNTK